MSGAAAPADGLSDAVVGPAAADADSDAALLDRARSGDRAAFGRLVERHHATLAAILRQRAGANVPLEDLLQEVFARTLAALPAFRGRSSYVTWATSIGLNLATDWQRKAARRARLAPPAGVQGEDVECPVSARPLDAVDARDHADLARAALDRLPPQVRLAVTLRIVEERDYEDVAKRLGAPVPRVRTWVSRGLARMRAALGDPDGGGA